MSTIVDLVIAQQLLVSLSLGLLVGLQRERSGSAIGGIRTFPLITLLGTICGQLARAHGGWILAAGFIALGALLLLPGIWRSGNKSFGGLTTEVAVLLLYALGAFLVSGPILLAVVLGAIVALLLHLKPPLHRFVKRIGERDMGAIMQLVFISMVVLPVLPNEGYGPYGALNPFEIWLMVVLIVSLSLGGFVAYKFFGATGGSLLAGMLGGVISSTATTVAAARQTRGNDRAVSVTTLVIIVASTVSVLRVLVEIAVVAPRTIPAMGPPLIAMLGVMVTIAIAAHLLWRKESGQLPPPENPAQLTTALTFAIIYALIKLGVTFAQDELGQTGVYLMGVISGLTDMDAITLSTARLVDAGQLEATLGWRTILIAAMANLAFKAGAVALVGGRQLLGRVAALFALSAAAGGVILWLWK